MNICALGDSIVKGVVLDEEKNKYVFLKDCFLNLTTSIIPVSLKNYAKFGCTVVKGRQILAKHIDEFSSCDYTIVEFGGNDCDLNWPQIADDPAGNHLAQVTPEDFRSNYIDLIKDVRSTGSNPVMLTLPPLDSERFFHWVSKDLNGDNILTFLGDDVEYISRWQAGYNDTVCELAAIYDVPLIDIRSAFLMKPDYKSLLCKDGMHPNKEGHKVLAKVLAEGLAAL